MRNAARFARRVRGSLRSQGSFAARFARRGQRLASLVGVRRANCNSFFDYNRARYYSPSLQRFISEDPLGLERLINLYAYVGNDPVSFRNDSIGQ
ncbi:MAG TPA: RHS repeat-associated core domain-containing protein [Blastocatellia bacterium]|nr:RHS repeat-associated core domain-containing protein [Blastocatellia bacterium]